MRMKGNRVLGTTWFLVFWFVLNRILDSNMYFGTLKDDFCL